MRKQSLIFIVCLCILSCLVNPGQFTVQAAGNPTLTSISPNSFAASINTPVIITGSNLGSITTVQLDTTLLIGVVIIDDGHIQAYVPWSISPGVYSLIVADAAGQSATLPEAVTIAAPATGWAANGPYGGDLINPSIDPKNSNRIYVSAQRSGVFRTVDAAETWQMERIAPFAGKIHFVYPPLQSTPIMYLDGGAGVNGLQRSDDNGLTWQQKMPEGYPVWVTTRGIEFRIAVDDNNPDRVYLALSSWNTVDSEMGLYISNNRGDSWTRAGATNGLHVTAVAVEPGNPDHVVIGTNDGKVLTSINGGTTWSSAIAVDDPNPADGLETINRLVVSPLEYGGYRKIWAISESSDWTYFSLNNGATWNAVAVSPNNTLYDVYYHAAIPGLVWAAAGGGFYSTDDGATWTALNAQIGEIHHFAAVSGSASQAETTLYAATGSGFYKSTDGGVTWVEKDQGLGAALPGAIEVSPFNADEAFAAVKGKGLMRTQDGGRHWQLLSIPNSNYRPGMTADPFSEGKFYFSSGGFEDTPAVYTTTDHGNTYSEQAIVLPTAFSGRQAVITALAAHPGSPGHLLAGLCPSYISFPNPTEGLIFASSDGGVTWEAQTMPAEAKCINSITYAPQTPDVIYAGTEGGLLVSTDGGATWTVPPQQPDLHRVGPVVVDPRNSQSVYIFGGPRFNNDSGGDVGTFATHDGGSTWEKLVGLEDYPVWEMQIVQVSGQYWIYAATMNGLRFLRDIPAEGFDPYLSWEKSDGIAGTATVDSFAAAAEMGRVVYYIGTSGGEVPVTSTSMEAKNAADTQVLAGGVYRRQGSESAPIIPVISGWKLKNKEGFGINNNVISALEVFNGQLYAATCNWMIGSRLWRTADGNTWTAASDWGLSATYGATNPAVIDLAVFDGKLYASVGWGSNEGQIWRSANGSTWERVTLDELASPSRTVLVMTVFNNMIYATAHGAGVEIWRSPTGDSGSWERVAQGGFGDLDNRAASGLIVFNDKLYAAALNNVDGITVWSTTNGTSWSQVNTTGFGDNHNTDAGGVAVFNNYLYVGVKNEVGGGQLWRYNGATWERVISDGFGNVDNVNIEGLYPLADQLFAVTTNSNSGMQIWRSLNGNSWTALNQDGLGKKENIGPNWSNAFAAFQGKFFLGTWPSTGGGEIWQYLGFDLYMPAIHK